MIKIILADDHQILLDGLSTQIEKEEGIELIGQAKNGKEAIEQVNILQPDVLVMDIDMPVLNGLDALEKIKQKHPELKVILLSLLMDKAVIQKAIKSGVDGYLFKDESTKELFHAIRRVASGNPYFSGKISLVLAEKKKASHPNTQVDHARLQLLTPREVQILRAVAEGFSSTEIAEQLFISARTVETHRRNIMEKLEVPNMARLIVFAVRNGLVE